MTTVSQARPPRWAFGAVAIVAFAFLISVYARCWRRDGDLTRFINIGSELNLRGIAAWRAAPKYMDPDPADRWGFDGQYYAEIALDPFLRDPGLPRAMDSVPYRARRILLPWLAALGGLGRPSWVLNAYAALNPLFWIAFAVLAVRLFRPHGWRGLAGLAAMLLTCGVVESLRRSLTDFPAFVLMTGAVLAGGCRGAGLLALAGLTREVDILGLAGLLETRPPWKRTLARDLALAALAAAPMALWFAYLAWRFRMHTSVDSDNLDWPFRAIAAKLASEGSVIRREGIHWIRSYRNYELHALLTIVSTLTQCFYLVRHPAWGSRLWRMAMPFALLFVCISGLAWEDHFTVTRHALPFTLAFNALLAARPPRRWLAWFVLGNCFVPYGIYHFSQMGRDLLPAEEIKITVGASGQVEAAFGAGWSEMGHNDLEPWRWALGPEPALELRNRGSAPVEARLEFGTLSYGPRIVEAWAGGVRIWSGLSDSWLAVVRTEPFALAPGTTEVVFRTDKPPAPHGADPRPVAFTLQHLRVEP